MQKSPRPCRSLYPCPQALAQPYIYGPAFRHLQKAGWGLGMRPLPLYRSARDGKLGEGLETRLRFLTVKAIV